MNQGEIVLCLLFKANKQLAETVEKRMSNFNHPSPGLEVRITLYFFTLLTSGADMSSVLTRLNSLGAACIASIQAEILRMVLTDGWTENDNAIQRFFQKLDVMCVCARENNRQRKSFLIG